MTEYFFFCTIFLTWWTYIAYPSFVPRRNGGHVKKLVFQRQSTCGVSTVEIHCYKVKNSGARLNKWRCNLFIVARWMPDGSVSGLQWWGSFKPSSQPNHSSVSVSWREQLWQTDFQLTEGKRESSGVIGGAEFESEGSESKCQRLLLPRLLASPCECVSLAPIQS